MVFHRGGGGGGFANGQAENADAIGIRAVRTLRTIADGWHPSANGSLTSPVA